LSKKRWGGGGLLLLVLLAILLAAPLLRHGAGSHPLSASLRSDLCPLLPDPPAPLSRSSVRVGAVNAGAASCEFLDAGGQTGLIVSLTSTRQASLQSPARTDRIYEVWVKEVAASTGNPVSELAGDWAMGSAYRDGDRQLVLAEDGGVLLYLDSRALDAATLAAYARAVAISLRKAATERGPLKTEAADAAANQPVPD
jgi:hypothetical protein